MNYTETHEWVRVEGKIGIVGISEYAQKELGEIVYIEMPKVGTKVNAGDEIVVLESTKAAADIYSPVSGEVIAVNEALKEDVSLLNSSPEKEGWIYQIALSNPEEVKELLSRQDYLS